MTFKKILAGVTACAITVGAGTVHKIISPVQTILTASAETLGDLIYEIQDGGVIITGCNSSAKSVDIPAEIGGLPVISIGEEAFYECYNLESITIPDSVSSIGRWAFFYCSRLESITIPDSVSSIGEYTFSECQSFESIVIPDSVISIEDSAFSGCTNLKSIVIPDSVISIEDYAFYGCTSLENINVSDKNEKYVSVDGVLFNKDKTELITYPAGNKQKEYTIPNSVKYIGYMAFDDCINITSVTIPDSVESIGEGAFAHCTNLESISIPDSVTVINVEAFFECTSLKSVIIPDSVESIYDEAFYGCTGLESIIIPDSVSYIGITSFGRCISLKSIIIPASVSHINLSAFSECTSLETIDVSDKNEMFSSEDGILFNKDKTELLLCPDGKKAEYTIPDTTVSIRKYAFSDCTSLEKVTIPDFITSIDEGTFNKCSSLENIVILNPECEIFDDLMTICNGYDNDRGGFYFIGTILGYENSTAQKYAEKYGYKFESLGEYKPAASGDLNGDGKTDAEDVEKMQKALTGKEHVTEYMDLNGDGKIDVFDGILLRRLILKNKQ